MQQIDQTGSVLTEALPEHVWQAATIRPPGVKFTQIPNWLLEAGISGLAMKVWGAIAKHLNKKTRRGFPKRRTIAEALGISFSSVDRGLRELRRLGALISRTRWRGDGGQSSNDYCLLWQPLPELLAAEPAPLTIFDEGGSSDLTSGDDVASAQSEDTSPEQHDRQTCGDPVTPLVKSDEGTGQLNQTYLEVGLTRQGADPAVPADGEPPAFCPKHPQGTPAPCGACKWHRLQHEAWEAAEAQRQAARQAEAARARAAELTALQARRDAEAIQACKRCDRHGERGGRRCDHRDPAARRAAVAASRAFFRNKPPTLYGGNAFRRGAA
ncbi:helix-turn-helix domain-containing protein [Nocardia asiatica]|uniref:helix-turn-helix domain-containing protein n=1 Tax=Nocardia asiatica TaxID=209252 RepID=UPI0024566B01|nr:helix-turn-helix domain-containing protein [Nocardia asiatica]